MQIQPYLFFEGRAEEAIEFYKKAIGAKVEMMMRNNESPDKPPPGMLPAGSENKIMHAALKIGDTQLMLSDGRCSGKPSFKGVSVSLSVTNEKDAERFFKGLSEGGQVHVPLAKTFFSPRFGMLADKFGVSWMVMTAPQT
jgi:PhnB protein